MALKPVYSKAPLTEYTALSLTGGRAHTEDKTIRTLYSKVDGAAMPEAALRLAALLDETSVSAEKAVKDALKKQTAEGAFPGKLAEALAAARGVWTVYEMTGDRVYLEALMRWAASVHANEDAWMSDSAIRINPADLMELLENLYRVTGRKVLLTMCARLRSEAMNWAGVLQTFSVRSAMSRIMKPEAMAEGVAEEKGNENGFYTRQLLTCSGMELGDGARAASASAVYSGNAQEAGAAMVGWEKLMKSHGAVCGGIHCDETVAGLSPVAPVSTAAVGAWAEALAVTLCRTGSEAAAEALERIAVNALPAAVEGGRLHDWLYENTMGAAKPAFAFDTKEEVRLAHLARGAAAVWENAVTMSPESVQINLLLPGVYTPRVAGTNVRLTIDDNGTITVAAKETAEWTMRIRIPAWAESAELILDGKKATVKPGTRAALKREWKNGDVVECRFVKALRTVEGYHQAVSVYDGPVLLTLPVEKKVMALCGQPERKDGKVVVAAAAVTGKCSAGNLPVKPETEAAAEFEMTAFASCKHGQAVLPVAAKA